jgi:hypothetical protein
LRDNQRLIPAALILANNPRAPYWDLLGDPRKRQPATGATDIIVRNLVRASTAARISSIRRLSQSPRTSEQRLADVNAKLLVIRCFRCW